VCVCVCVCNYLKGIEATIWNCKIANSLIL